MLRVMARPMPEPVCLVVKNGSNMRARSSGVMPMPRSRTDDLDRPPSRLHAGTHVDHHGLRVRAGRRPARRPVALRRVAHGVAGVGAAR